MGSTGPGLRLLWSLAEAGADHHRRFGADAQVASGLLTLGCFGVVIPGIAAMTSPYGSGCSAGRSLSAATRW